MDDLDYAQEKIDALMENRIKEHQYQQSQTVSAYPVGECRNCSTKLDDGRAYCDKECADDFAYRQKLNKYRCRP